MSDESIHWSVNAINGTQVDDLSRMTPIIERKRGEQRTVPSNVRRTLDGV